jgi:hypothetical protein
VIEQHQNVKDRLRKNYIDKIANSTKYPHEIPPAFLDLVGQAFWDWIIKIAMIKRVTAANTFDCQPPSTNKAKS